MPPLLLLLLVVFLLQSGPVAPEGDYFKPKGGAHPGPWVEATQGEIWPK